MLKGRSCILMVVWIIVITTASGCDNLRFAPKEIQKQNAYLHNRTIQAAVVKSQKEESSPTLRKLISQAEKQSEVVLAYYGMPREIPDCQKVEDILNEENTSLTNHAYIEASQRPDPWDLADHLLEMSIALSGIAGGVFGGKLMRSLKLARQKSQALREIITGNERFKQQNPVSTTSFKQAHQGQSEATRTIVAALK